MSADEIGRAVVDAAVSIYWETDPGLLATVDAGLPTIIASAKWPMDFLASLASLARTYAFLRPHNR